MNDIAGPGMNTDAGFAKVHKKNDNRLLKDSQQLEMKN
jgi:hypothetical protein